MIIKWMKLKLEPQEFFTAKNSSFFLVKHNKYYYIFTNDNLLVNI